jgi:hypothetical protein
MNYCTANQVVFKECHKEVTVAATASCVTLSLLKSYIYGAPCKAEILTSYIYGLTFRNAESRLFLFAAQCYDIEPMQKVFLCNSCV